jgi:hypothetical protein
MGWFAVHRPTTASKQRALNINADIAVRLLSTRVLNEGGVELRCKCLYPGAEHTAKRNLWKVGKNWRFGGPKLEGDVFLNIREGDFFLLRSLIHNDGDKEVSFNFISADADRDSYHWLKQCEPTLHGDSMTAVATGSEVFKSLSAKFFGTTGEVTSVTALWTPKAVVVRTKPVPPIPREEEAPPKPRTLRDRIRSPHIMSQMLKVSSDLSAHAQYEFMNVLEELARQLRVALKAAGMISLVSRAHQALWNDVRGQKVAFVDGGMANLNMLGAAPVAARVGGYIVKPGMSGDERERFVMVKHLIDELFVPPPGGAVYTGLFPDPGALRDAARISVECAGAVHILQEDLDVNYLFLHGALVNPVSRYTDLMENGQPIAVFPDFSPKAIEILLPETEKGRSGRDANFIRVYLRQLQLLQQSKSIVCGVVERESQATSVYKELLKIVIAHPEVPPLLPKSPDEWREWFENIAEQFRVTDVLLFRCVLEPGEVLTPVAIDRNEMRRAPQAWAADIQHYPRPWVSYLLPSEWSQPVRVEVFQKDLGRFQDLARLLMHCSWLLPRYAFPVGLDIVDKYAKVPNWMSRPINTNTAVQALRRAMDAEDAGTFNALRRMLCGSTPPTFTGLRKTEGDCNE